MRKITTCSGIGDLIFLAQKLINQPEKFDWIFPASEPRRAFQVQEVLPQLINSVDHQEKLTYRNIESRQYNGLWSKAPQNLTLAANSWVDSGKRIEGFLPDLETSFLLPFVTNPHDKEAAETVLKGDRWIGIYTSAYSMARQWGNWYKEEWLKLIKLLKESDTSYKFVFFGASYDIGISDEIMEAMPAGSFIKMYDQSLSVVIEVMRRLEMFISFPSGLPIMHEAAGGKRTVMFFPVNLKKQIGSWADPERIKSGNYKGCQFCPPEQIFEWIKLNWL